MDTENSSLGSKLPVLALKVTNESGSDSDSDSDSDTEQTLSYLASKTEALAELKLLSQYAHWHAHPEEPVTTNGLQSRCYFDRGSVDVVWLDEGCKGIVDVETFEDQMIREEALAELKELKRHARYWLHPEDKVISNGLQARCYFDRPSAPEVETKEYADTRAEALAELKLLSQYAHWHAHPEEPVTTNGLQSRCFFERPSAPEIATKEYADTRAEALAELKLLSQYAHWHAHPEEPVTTNGLQSRCFFERPSAPEVETKEYADTRAEALAELKLLSQYAHWYAHPEEPVTTNGFQSRCYYDRYASLTRTPITPPSSLPSASVHQYTAAVRKGHERSIIRPPLHNQRPRVDSDQFALEMSPSRVLIGYDLTVKTLLELDEEPEVEGDSNGEGEVVPPPPPGSGKGEGLGRSPSSVMLFEMDGT